MPRLKRSMLKWFSVNTLRNKTAASLIIPMRLDTCPLISQKRDLPAPLKANVVGSAVRA